MSIAYPAAIRERGHAHPAILRAARLIAKLGWRVTSIYRPSGTHMTGKSMDIAPLEYRGGGFGPVTATLVWRILHNAFPANKWLVNAEYDHLHVQLFTVDAIGQNTVNGTMIRKIVVNPNKKN